MIYSIKETFSLVDGQPLFEIVRKNKNNRLIRDHYITVETLPNKEAAERVLQALNGA